MKTMMKKLVTVGMLAAGVVVAASASATTVLVFGQNGTANTIVATNPTATSTLITGTDIAVTLTALENGASGTQAFFDFSATNVGASFVCGSNICQHFQGTFSFNSLANNTGTNYLSGSFTDSVFGTGNGLTLTASTPSNIVTFASSVITSLGLDRAISLSFTNVTPAVSQCGGNTTLCAFTSNVSGNFSGNNNRQVPEPISLGLMGLGLAAMGLARRRRS